MKSPSMFLLVLTLSVTAASIGCAGSAGAVSDESHTISIEQPVNNDLLAAGNTVQVDNQIQGDLAAAGSSVTISAPVAGYVMAAGRDVKIAGRVDNDLWAAGETVTVEGEIADMAMVAGRNVQLQAGASVGDNANLAGETVRMDGRIERDLRIGASNAAIGGQVGGNVEANARHVAILPGAAIEGDLIVRAAQPPDISPDARVGGQVRYEPLEQGGFAWPFVWLMGFLALLILGLPLVAFFPAWPARIARIISDRFGASLGIGVLFLIVVPIVIGVIAITIVGIPLAAVLLALYFVAVVLSGVFVSYEVGAWILTRMRRPDSAPWLRLTLGALIVSLLMSLPAVGWLFAIIIVIVGAGALTIERRRLAEA